MGRSRPPRRCSRACRARPSASRSAAVARRLASRAGFDVLVEDAGDLAPCARPSSAARWPRHAGADPASRSHVDLHERLVAESLAYSTLQAGPEFAAWLAARRRRAARDAGRPAVRARREGARLRLTLDRPRKRSAFSSRCATRSPRLARLADDSIEEVLLDGEGPCFCSGGDLDEFGSFPDPATAHAVRSARSPARLLSLCAQRARAEVHGACVGAGCELPAFCRRVRAREDAFFQLPEVGMGLVPGAGGTASLPGRIGRQRTAWLALSGSRIDAATALRWGLVDEIAH
jgi:hypothetical protein